MRNSFSRWLAYFSRRGPGVSRPAGDRRARLNVEALEDRLAPAVYNVISTADNTIAVITAGHAGTAADPFLAPSLRSAISAANANAGGNTINLAVAGTYQITLKGTAGETDNKAGEFAILPAGGNLSIVNTSGGTAVVDGAELNRVFDINPTPGNTTAFTVTLQGFTIQNGDAFDPASPDGPTSTGGGIRDQGNASLTLTNMVLTNNFANADGGGVVFENTVNNTWTLTVNNSTISNNHSGDAGGGIDTDGTGTVIINSGTVITGNTDLNQGAGVYIDAITVGTVFEGANATITGTTISNNQALATGITASGGGISNAGNGAITIANSTISGNFSGGMGGGFSDENNVGTLTVSNSLFLNNSATSDGGGIQEGGPSTTITNTSFHGNSSGGSGGGLFANGTTLTVNSSTFDDNTATTGGGAIEVQTTGTGTAGSTITNVTITANSALNNAGANGGGIDAPATFTGSLALLNDTINGNFATNGGGIFWAGAAGSLSLKNTIVARNTASTAGPDANNPAGTFTDLGGNLIGIAGTGSGNTGFTAATTQTGTTSSPLDPLLGPLASNAGPVVGATGAQIVLPTEALLANSPAIDKGVSASVTTDERGFPRPDSRGSDTGTLDVGAFESNPLTGNAAFVQTLYFDFLHRLGQVNNASDAGSWVNALNAGTITPQTVASDIARSSEALGVLVDGLYLKILGRASDPTGRAGFVSALESGATVEQVITVMVTSPEYTMLTGNSDTTFVQSLYTKLLGRTASSLEVAGQLSLLASLGRTGVANEFLASLEFRTDAVEQLYGFPTALSVSVISVFPNLLHRPGTPTATEVASWVNSGLDILSVQVSITQSAEFSGGASSGLFF